MLVQMQQKSPREEWMSLKGEVTEETLKRRQEKKQRDEEWQSLLKAPAVRVSGRARFVERDQADVV